MDMKQAAELLSLIRRDLPVDTIQYVTELMGEAEDIGVGHGKMIRGIERVDGELCERCKLHSVDSTLHFDGCRWDICRDCREDAITFFNKYMYGDDND
jgi:hypothetical protein